MLKFEKPGKKTKKKSKKKTSEAQKIKNRLDKLWSKVVRKIGHCELCGKTGLLHAHHVFSRRCLNTRWNTRNGLCLCPSCHTFSTECSAHTAPREFNEWLDKYYGWEELDELARLSKLFFRPTIEELLEIEKDLKIMLETP